METDTVRAPSPPRPPRVDVVAEFLAALGRGDLDRAMSLLSPHAHWSYIDHGEGRHVAAAGWEQLRSLFRGGRQERAAEIVCATTAGRFVLVSERVVVEGGRARERHGAYVVQDGVVTSAWVTDLPA